MSIHNFNLLEKETGGSTCEVPLYNDILEWPHGLAGYFDFNQALA